MKNGSWQMVHGSQTCKKLPATLPGISQLILFIYRLIQKRRPVQLFRNTFAQNKNAMKKLTGLLAYSIFLLTGCNKERITGEGPLVTQERTVANFTGLRAMGSANVVITQGAAFKVQVKEYENLLPHFETKLNGSVLEVGFEEGIDVKNSKAEVFITMPALQSVKTAGSGNITAVGAFPLANTFDAEITGSGNINIEQCSAGRFNSFIRGSGNIAAFGLIGVEAFTQTEGSGNVEITATNKLNVKISGSGNVYYKSTPVITANINGSGQIIPR